MPLRKIPGPEAIQNYRSNRNATWPSRATPDTNRIEPMCRPAFAPSFKLKHGEKIFTIGSCFARNIERALAAHGFDVVTSRLDWPDNSTETHGTQVFNNYGVASIENELRWALDPEHPFDPALHTAEVAPGRFVDLHIPLLRASPKEKVAAYRAAITGVTKQVVDCRVVIITLGLSELWYDTQSQTYLNTSPPRMIVLREPERFEVHQLSFQDTIEKLNAIFKLLRTYCRKDQRILLTVSPVPMGATYVQNDVLVANTYSKSLLRTAAEQVAANNTRVDYFPSYESVILSDRSVAWEDDQIHVRRELIALNVERMVDAYKPNAVSADLGDLTLAFLEAEEALNVQDTSGAMRKLEPLKEYAHLDAEFATIYVDLCLRLNRLNDARDIIARLPEEPSGWRLRLLQAMLTIADGASDEGVAALKKLAEEFPTRPRIQTSLIEAHTQRMELDEALTAAFKLAKLVKTSSDPLRRAAAIHRLRGDRQGAETAYNLALERPHIGDLTILEYLEFLIEDKQLEKARRMVDLTAPTSPAMRDRFEELRAFLPAPSSSAGRQPEAAMD